MSSSTISSAIAHEYTQICEKTAEQTIKKHPSSTVTATTVCCGSSRNINSAGGNRYSNILPNESTRVVIQLTSSNGLLQNDYINANLFEYDDKCYILTQAPLPSTMQAFWTMVWQKKSSVIISLNRLFEGNTRKGDAYWPAVTGDSVHFGVMRVTLVSTHIMASNNSASVGCVGSTSNSTSTSNCPSISSGCGVSGSSDGGCGNAAVIGDILVRTLRLSNLSDETEEPREIYQIHYLGWPDFGVPNSTQPIRDVIHLCNLFRKENKLEGPPVIHCSAGVGRTGSLVGIMCALQKPFFSKVEEFKKKYDTEISLFFRYSQKTDILMAHLFEFVGNLNVKDIVLSLRRQRHSSTVQTPSQYDFIYQALMDETLCAGTSREVLAFYYESFAKRFPSSSSCSSPLSPHTSSSSLQHPSPLSCHEEFHLTSVRKLKIKPRTNETELF